MELHIVTRGFGCTDSIREYVEKRISPPVAKYLHDKDDIVVHVRLEDSNHHKTGPNKQVSVDVRFPKKHRVHVSDQGEELYAVIYIVSKELENTLKRDKDKYLVGVRSPRKQLIAKMLNRS